MLNFKNKGFITIEEAIEKIPSINKKINILELSDNKFEYLDLDKIPEHITHINLSNNTINEINWGTRGWGTICLANNGLELELITGLICEKLDLTDNFNKDIGFIHCHIGELILKNNSLKEINFIECTIKKLDLSLNKLTEITNLPKGIIDLNLSSNKIDSIDELPDSLLFLNLSENSLSLLPNIPVNLFKLDLSFNKFKTFKVEDLPKSLDWFDISDNLIKDPDVLFESVKNSIDTIYMDENYKSDLPKHTLSNLNENFIDSDNDNDTEISLNIISRRARSISIESFESINSNSGSGPESDDEMIGNIINNFTKKTKSNTDESFYKEISWTPEIEPNLDSTSSSENDSNKPDNNQVNSDLPSNTENVQNNPTPENNYIEKEFNWETIRTNEEPKPLSIEEMNERRIKAYQAAFLRNRMLNSFGHLTNPNNMSNNDQMDSLHTGRMSIDPIELTEDQKIILEIRQARLNQISRTYGNKYPIQLQWEVEL